MDSKYSQPGPLLRDFFFPFPQRKGARGIDKRIAYPQISKYTGLVTWLIEHYS